MTAARWARTFAITMGLQWSMVLVISAAAGSIAGPDGAWSGFAGGAAIALPNSGLAAYLWLKAHHAHLLSATTFLVGELVKLVCTLAALYVATRWFGARTVWPALIIGVIGALKAQWLAVWFTRND